MVDTSILSTSSTLNDNLDELNFRKDNGLKKALNPDENVVLSTVLYKYNRKLKRQERSLLITSQAIYNINQRGVLTSFISVFNSNFKIRRKIEITKLAGITVSNLSSEFVLHINDEYDYRYSSPGKRDKILLALSQVYYRNVKGRPLPFYFKEDINLIYFTTTKENQKNQTSRMPSESPSICDETTLKTKLEESNKKIQTLKAATQTVFNKKTNQKVTLDDFDLIKVLGRGAFGKVMLVEKKDNKKLYAMKSIHKEQIIGQEQVEHTKTERFLLEKINCPFLVSLEFAFQTPEKIFFVMKFLRGGELFHHLRAAKRFEEKRAKFYAAEILLALEYLQSLNVAYRDLKPENILLDDAGHICLTDFGMAKPLAEGATTKSFVGTPEYLAPEIIQGKGHGKPVDWWTLGVLIYEMIIGTPPFYSKDQTPQEMFNNILKKEIDFGYKVKLSLDAKDIILKLLTKDPSKRLGTNGTAEIKSHPWFSDIDWVNLEQKNVIPPFKPTITGEYDVENFDDEFTSEDACNSVIPDSDMRLVNKYQKEFKGFSYTAGNDLLTKNK